MLKEKSVLDNFDVTVEWNEKVQKYQWVAAGGVYIESHLAFDSLKDCRDDWKRFIGAFPVKNWEWRN